MVAFTGVSKAFEFREQMTSSRMVARPLAKSQASEQVVPNPEADLALFCA